MTLHDDGLVERALFLASGQDDPHSTTITELCDAITRLKAERDGLANALEPFAERAGGYSSLPGFETDERFAHLRNARAALSAIRNLEAKDAG